jgi:hypothetical protein
MIQNKGQFVLESKAFIHWTYLAACLLFGLHAVAPHCGNRLLTIFTPVRGLRRMMG